MYIGGYFMCSGENVIYRGPLDQALSSGRRTRLEIAEDARLHTREDANVMSIGGCFMYTGGYFTYIGGIFFLCILEGTLCILVGVISILEGMLCILVGVIFIAGPLIKH